MADETVGSHRKAVQYSAAADETIGSHRKAVQYSAAADEMAGSHRKAGTRNSTSVHEAAAEAENRKR